MRATQDLPPSYRLASTVDVSKNQSLLLVLNVVGLIIMGVVGFLLFQLMYRMRPGDTLRAFNGLQFHGIVGVLGLIAAVLILTALHIILHEAIHGVFFWLYTRTRPRFAFKWAYAYAAAPDWYIERWPFLVTTLAPLLVITTAGIMLFLIIPTGWLVAVWFVVVMNASGAVGDLLVAYRLLHYPPGCLVQDHGDAVRFYIPSERLDEGSLP